MIVVVLTAEPNCRAFITHGGLLSVLEAVHFAIPLIGVPVFADQPFNMVKVEQAEIGIRLRVLNISTEAVSWALDEVLHNPMYGLIKSKQSCLDRSLGHATSLLF